MLQAALILEPYTNGPCRATFDLNRTMGDLFRDLNLELALRHYEKAIDIGLRTREETDKFGVYNVLAGLYLKHNNPKKARQSYQDAIEELHRAGIRELSSVYNNIGWFYSKTGNSDSALWYFNEALRSYAKPGPDDLTCNIAENIAREEEKAGQLFAALQKYRSNEDYYTQRETHPPNLLRNKVNTLRVRIKMRERNLGTFIDSIKSFCVANARHLDGKDLLSFYELAYRHYSENRKPDAAQEYFTSLHHLKDSLTRADVEHANALSGVLLRAQAFSFRSAYDAYRAELQAVTVASQKNRLIAILSLVSGALIIFALMLYYQKRKKEMQIMRQVSSAELRAKDFEARSIRTELENMRLHTEAEVRRKELEAKQAQLQLEHERLRARSALEVQELERRAIQNELELKKKDLTNIILMNTQVHESNQEMIDRIEKIAGLPEPDKSLRSLLVDLKSRKQIGERLGSLQNNIDHLNTEFYQKLKTRFPQLTKAEAEMCGYILINLSNKDIAILKSVEPASVKMSKTRLRKKLGLAPEDDLLAFIRAI
jgi:Tfp pilus assembly protein PilF/DNA-binding CsgD family transcriptional regulator